jgi:hypothetical protein
MRAKAPAVTTKRRLSWRRGFSSNRVLRQRRMVPDAARGVSGSLRHSFLGDADRLMPGISPKRRRHEYFHDHARIDEIMFDGA